MEVFQKNFSLYSSVLRFTALWPYEESLRIKIQRVTICVLNLLLLAIQLSTLKWVEISVNNVAIMTSYACPMLLYFLRYVGFAANLTVMRNVFDSFSKDYSATKDPVELDIYTKEIIGARRVIVAFVGLSVILIAYLFLVLMIPTILRSEIQLQYLHIFGFYFPEMNQQTNWVVILFAIVNTLGLISLAGTEGSIAVCASYLCGLLEIASYRVEIAIDNAIHSTTSDLVQVGPAVELHKQAYAREYSTLKYLMSNMIVSYLIAILAVVISFALNLYRLLLAVQNLQDYSNLFFSFNDVLYHFVIMYLNNLSGQRVINTSEHIFNKICSSSWYYVSLRSQKLILFMLMRAVNTIRCDLGGLYDLGYEGFSMMMSTSFSYFTVMCSTQ